MTKFFSILLISTIGFNAFGQDSLQNNILQETVISASRTPEKLLKSAFTVNKISGKSLLNTASTELISSLQRLGGIDVSRSSWFVTSLSTRGFNSSKAERILQLADNVDYTSPTSSLYGGNWMGISNLDIESVEILHGANSAVYGSGAFNGVVLETSKNPFKKENQGFQVQLKGGTRSLLGLDVLYANQIGKRIGLKINFNTFTAEEFVGNSTNAIKAKTEGGLNGSDPLNNAQGSPFGWNKLNYFGDVGSTITDPNLTKYNDGKAYRIYMPGFAESDLILNGGATEGFLKNQKLRAKHLRINPSLYFKINDNTTVKLEYRYSLGSGIFQSTSRFAWRDMKYDLLNAEVKSKTWFLRAYQMQDFGGKAYEIGGLGSAMQSARFDNNISRSANYFAAWNTIFAGARGNGIAAGKSINDWSNTPIQLPAIAGGQSIEAAAQTAFDLTKTLQIPVGSDLFNATRTAIANGVGDIKINGTTTKGAAFSNSAIFRDFSGQKEFNFSETKFLIGASSRFHTLQSAGTLVSDGVNSPVGQAVRNKITNRESGAYALIQQNLLNQKLQLTAAGRVDNFKNFGTHFSPRISGVFSPTENHSFRVNYSTAFRQPAQLDQFIYIDYGTLLLQGNVDKGYIGFSDAARTKPLVIKPLEVEKLNTIELGYKGLIGERVFLDVSYYLNKYNNFIGTLRFYGREDGLASTSADYAKPASDKTRGRFIQTWLNYDKAVTSQGILINTQVNFKQIVPYFNYTFTTISDVKDLIAGFNTPKHKFNIGADVLVGKKLSASVNYRWSSTYQYFMPFDEGQIDAFGTLDAQVNYKMKSKTTLQAGATNIINANAVYVYGSAPISRVVYLSALFNFSFDM
jgi:outer membrane receptor for ferrienterochelin and colicin